MFLSKEIIEFATEIVEHLRQRGETISTAESLTAGSVSSAIVTIAGASDVFVGGTTAYRDEIKISHLSIDPELIHKHTAISAGPSPLNSHPAGTVWVAIEGPVSQTIELALSGERESVRNAATSSAIATFARILRHRA